MNLDLVYFFKANIALACFYIMYKLCFSNDTFFHIRRTVLISGILFAFAYPFIVFHSWVKEQKILSNAADYYVELKELVVTSTDAGSFSLQSIQGYLFYVYLGISLLLVANFLIKLCMLLRIRLASQRTQYRGTTLYVPRGEMAPFSFFNWIFVDPARFSESEISEVVLHEQTHSKGGHSFDLLILEVVKILCWVNPFVWLLSREVEQNLEYIADNAVVSSGIDAKAYQYHLVEVASNTPISVLHTGFNYYNLKKRILVLNQKRSKRITCAKYALLVPVCVLFIATNSIETVTKLANSMVSEIKEIPAQLAAAQHLPQVTLPQFMQKDKSEQPVSLVVEKPKAKPLDPNEEIFVTVEDMPEFPGGQRNLMSFIGRNIKYPVVAQENGIQGRVVVQFVINKEGQVADATVVRGVDPSLDKEALRVINAMPNWKPGSQRGNPVNVKYTVPVQFRLQM